MFVSCDEKIESAWEREREKEREREREKEREMSSHEGKQLHCELKDKKGQRVCV